MILNCITLLDDGLFAELSYSILEIGTKSPQIFIIVAFLYKNLCFDGDF